MMNGKQIYVFLSEQYSKDILSLQLGLIKEWSRRELTYSDDVGSDADVVICTEIVRDDFVKKLSKDNSNALFVFINSSYWIGYKGGEFFVAVQDYVKGM
ncbi:hypothetical protein CUBB_gp204 [Staphylococcus phage CUB-B]|nr:hypothetical protein CUBB_gp204 [Staphylococcus phage CUB-B]